MPFKRRSKNLDKSTLTSLQGGERSCACIASYNFQPTLQLDVIIPNLEVECKREGVHPVRVNTRHCEGSKCNGLGGQPSCHCEACEARRGNPVEQRLNLLDCFTTFATTVNPSKLLNYSTTKLLNCEEGGAPCLA